MQQRKYSPAADYVNVTATHPDGAQWGWPNEPVFRYEGRYGWAWCPCSALNEQVGDIIDMNAETINDALVWRANQA